MGSIVAGRTGHPAARMGAGTTHVKSRDRCPVLTRAQNWTCGPQLVERHAAVHDIAINESERALQIERRQRRFADNRIAEIRRVLGDGIDNQPRGVLLYVIPVAAIWQLRREVLAKQHAHMLSGRCKTVVEHTWDKEFHNRFAGPTLCLCIEIGAVHVVERWRDDDAAAEMIALITHVAKFRQLGKRKIHSKRARAGDVVRDSPCKPRIEVFDPNEFLKQQSRMQIADYTIGQDVLAALGGHAGSAAVLHDHLCNGRPGADYHAFFIACPFHGVRDRAHSANGMPPCALFAVHFAEGVMQENISRAGSRRTRETSYDCVEDEYCPARLAFEPT